MNSPKILFFISEHRLQLLNVDELVNEAIEAHKAGEMMEVMEVRYIIFNIKFIT